MSYFRALYDPGYPGRPSRSRQAWVHHKGHHSKKSYQNDSDLMAQYFAMQQQPMQQMGMQMQMPMQWPNHPPQMLPYDSDNIGDRSAAANHVIKKSNKQWGQMAGIAPPSTHSWMRGFGPAGFNRAVSEVRRGFTLCRV